MDSAEDHEFEEACQRFVAKGGLERTKSTREDWERFYRIATRCKHGIRPVDCERCKPVKKS